MESGMVTAMIKVARQFARKSRIINPVKAAAINASRTTPLTAALTKTDWSDTGWIPSAFGRPAAICGSIDLTCAMMASVDASPLFSICSRAERVPLVRTMLVCGA
jgi:hypothetical protein